MADGGDEFPDVPSWIIPDGDDETEVDIGDFKAVAEWIYLNHTTQDDLDLIHDTIDSYRDTFMDVMDLDDHATMETVWGAWEFTTHSMSWFVENDCDHDSKHLMEHVARGMRMSAIILLGMSRDLPTTLRHVDGEDEGLDYDD
tara:strand:+ start:104 stop:532 length:429 start_codon:yes stop_codon:yes gene_type:complete